ncbi:MAG: hypothetical protein JWO88_2133 [Frankiales bacterium]|nr:hypothetical protein [Frankiales bacterium]
MQLARTKLESGNGAEDAPAAALHPLLVSELMKSAKIDPFLTEAQIWTHCLDCLRLQSLSEATIEPADDPQVITRYWCLNGCRALVVTAYASWPQAPKNSYRLRDFLFVNVAGTLMRFHVSFA